MEYNRLSANFDIADRMGQSKLLRYPGELAKILDLAKACVFQQSRRHLWRRLVRWRLL